MSRLWVISATLIALIANSAPVVAAPAVVSQKWDFSVLLDGDEIGYHRFELTADGDKSRLTSKARFDVRFLFVNAFRYRHENTEVWSDGCLAEIVANTKANRKKLAVSGFRVNDSFVINDGEDTDEIVGCVMTFAYWNPEFLEQSRLLDPQSGEYLDVEVERLGTEFITVRGETVPALAYQITARRLQLTLWYSAANEWLALESIAKGGRVLRYELT